MPRASKAMTRCLEKRCARDRLRPRLANNAAALRGPEMAFDVAGSAASWATLVARIEDGSLRLSLREENRIRDEFIIQQDAERDAARRALQDRIAREQGIVRGRRR